MTQSVLPRFSITVDSSSKVEFQVHKDMEDRLNMFPSFYRGLKEVNKPCANWIYDMVTTTHNA
jgi:hypothetical protein